MNGDLFVSPRAFTRRSVPMFLAGIIAGAAVLTPAMSGAAAFLTQKKADKRYLGNTTVATSTSIVPGDSAAALTVACPPGLQALNGGVDSPAFVSTLPTTQGVEVSETKPVLTGARATGWTVEVRTGTGSYSVTVYAVCSP